MEDLRTVAIGVLLWPIAILAALMLFVAWLGG
jgi:hypothetical protein